MDPILHAFPTRPLTLRPGRGRLGAWVGALAMIAFAAMIAALLWIEAVPGIRDDLTVRDGAAPSALARIERGTCSSRMALFQSCDLTMSLRGKDLAVTHAVSYLFVAPHMGNWTTQVLVNPAHPRLPTTALGLEYLTNRIITAAVIACFVPLLIYGGISMLRSQGRLRRRVAALSGQMLVPEVVRLVSIGQGPVWVIADAQGVPATWPVGKRTKPFLLDPARGLMLALRAPGSEAFPLDDKLRLVDLTPEERARLLALPRG